MLKIYRQQTLAPALAPYVRELKDILQIGDGKERNLRLTNLRDALGRYRDKHVYKTDKPTLGWALGLGMVACGNLPGMDIFLAISGSLLAVQCVRMARRQEAFYRDVQGLRDTVNIEIDSLVPRPSPLPCPRGSTAFHRHIRNLFNSADAKKYETRLEYVENLLGRIDRLPAPEAARVRVDHPYRARVAETSVEAEETPPAPLAAGKMRL